MSKLGLEKAEEPETKLPTVTGSQRRQENSRETSTSVSLTMLKPLTVWILTNCGKLLKYTGPPHLSLSIPDHVVFLKNTRSSYLSPEKPVCGSRSNS